MKTILIAAFTSLSFVLVSCDDKNTDPHAGHNHGPGEHGKAVPHDHDGDGKPDHGPDEHCTLVPHDHPKKIAGPNGGKVMTSPHFKNEFLVTDDRMVRITFLDKDNKPVAVGTQEVSLVGGDRSNPTNLSFSKSADGMSLVSSAKLPEGNNIPVIINVKTSADAPTARASFSLDLSHCKGCNLKEYACTCDHGHEH